MQFNENATLDSSQMSPSGGGGGGVAIGGGLGLIIMILGLIFGFNPGDLLGGSTTDTTNQNTSSSSNEYADCKTGADIQSNRECRWLAYVNSINGYWETQFKQGEYKLAKTRPFSGQVKTACGAATSQVGPFYCPADQQVYIDTAFADQLLQQLGAQGGLAAEAYILAHEYGHHISNITGQLQKAQSAGNQTGPDSMAVRSELQADCYAGVWFKNAASGQDAIVSGVTQDDLNRIVDAAAAVGDDRIQSSTTGQVNPESWTHGSAKMRQNWVGKGFTAGNPQVCATVWNAQDLES